MKYRASISSASLTGIFHYLLIVSSGYLSKTLELSETANGVGALIIMAVVLITGWIWVLGVFNSSDQITSGNLLKTRFSDLKQTAIHCCCWLTGSGVTMITINLVLS